MKILHISTYDIIGGAARAAYRLHSGLRCLGYNSSMLVLNSKSNDPTIKKFSPPMDLRSRLRRRLRRELINRSFQHYRKSRPSGYELFSNDRSEHGTDLLIRLRSCDVVNLHWIAGFVDYQSIFPQLIKHVSIVWTLHDMNFFSGGCHYDDGCGNFLNYCGFCPQLGRKKRMICIERSLLEKNVRSNQSRKGPYCIFKPQVS